MFQITQEKSKIKSPSKKSSIRKSSSTIRLPPRQAFYTELVASERSEKINRALTSFFSWNSYAQVNWDKLNPEDGETWIDAVETGIEYRLRKTLLPPTSYHLTFENMKEMARAVEIVEKQRPSLKKKGISSGIIRSALAFQMLKGEVEKDHEVVS